MNPIQTLSSLCALAILAGSAQAQLVEDFESGNPNNWRIDFDGTYNGFSIPAIPATHNASGGNPGGYISFSGLAAQVDVWFLNNEHNADWTGDFRAKGVEGFDMDVRHLSGVSPFGMHMNVLIADDNGTPELWDDIFIWSPYDPGTYSFAGFGAAIPTGVWHGLHWDMDASSTTLPAGWTVWSFGGVHSGNDDADWNAIIQDVDYVAFTNGPPWGGFVLGTIDIEFDNLGIDTGEIATYFCLGDGTDVVCPCGNNGGTGEGCLNSSGSGSVIGASGSNSVLANDLVLLSTGSPAGKPGVFFQGDGLENGGLGSLFGDGVRCVGGNIQRFDVVVTDGSGAASTAYSTIPANAATAGDTRYYQWWHRDPNVGPCAGDFNVSNAAAITWIN